MLRSCRIKGRGEIVFIITLILFTSTVSTTSNAQLDTPWDVSRESYAYNYKKTSKYYDIDGTSEDKTITDEKTVEMWEVNSTENEITFRTNNLERFLGCVNCESIECHQEYKDAWQYDETDDSLTVTYLYDKAGGKLGFLDPILGTLLCFEMEIPLDPVNLPGYCLAYWGGMGFVFLPVLDANFSFISEFPSYENFYDEFNIQVEDTFTFSGKKFEGYSYEIETMIINDIKETKWVDYVKYSYNTKGVLYKHYSEADYYRIVDGNLKRKIHTELIYEIESIDEDLIVGVSWPLSLLGFVIVIALWKKKYRKNGYSSVSET